MGMHASVLGEWEDTEYKTQCYGIHIWLKGGFTEKKESITIKRTSRNCIVSYKPEK